MKEIKKSQSVTREQAKIADLKRYFKCDYDIRIILKRIDDSSKNILKSFQCHICKGFYKNKLSLKSHRNYAHKLKPLLLCPYKSCTYSTKHKQYFTVHTKIHTGEKPHQCLECGRLFRQKTNLKSHMQRQHESTEKRYKCNYRNCSLTFHKRSELKIHTRVHTGEKPYKCTQCNYTSAQSGHFKTHLLIHKNIKPYKCELCNYSCTTNGGLIVHVRSHTGEKPYSCNLCNYACATKSSLPVHARTHTGEKPYACGYSNCTYKSTAKSSLNIHEKTCKMRPGGPIKLFKCKFCIFSCVSKGGLTNHMRTHTGEKPYNCTQCKYKCARNSSLAYHMQTHTGVKPYICKYSGCDFKTARSYSLKVHVNTHTGIKPHVCTYLGCSYKAVRKCGLKMHVKNIHEKKTYD